MELQGLVIDEFGKYLNEPMYVVQLDHRDQVEVCDQSTEGHLNYPPQKVIDFVSEKLAELFPDGGVVLSQEMRSAESVQQGARGPLPPDGGM